MKSASLINLMSLESMVIGKLEEDPVDKSFVSHWTKESQQQEWHIYAECTLAVCNDYNTLQKRLKSEMQLNEFKLNYSFDQLEREDECWHRTALADKTAVHCSRAMSTGTDKPKSGNVSGDCLVSGEAEASSDKYALRERGPPLTLLQNCPCVH